MRIVICDVCKKVIPNGMFKSYKGDEDFCSQECVKKKEEEPVGG